MRTRRLLDRMLLRPSLSVASVGLAVLLILQMILMGCAHPAHAALPQYVTLAASSATGAPGDTVTVTVSIVDSANVDSLSVLKLCLVADSHLLEPVEIRRGSRTAPLDDSEFLPKIVGDRACVSIVAAPALDSMSGSIMQVRYAVHPWAHEGESGRTIPLPA